MKSKTSQISPNLLISPFSIAKYTITHCDDTMNEMNVVIDGMNVEF